MDKEPKEESPVPHDIEIPIHSCHPLNSIARNAMAIGVLLELWKIEDGGSVMLGDVMREAILTIGKYYARLNDAKLGAAVREALEDVGPLPESLSDAPQGDALGSIGGNSDLPAKERGRSLTARFGGPFSFRRSGQ